MAAPSIPGVNLSESGMYCPVCRQNGVANIDLIRNQHIFKCASGHALNYTELMSLGPDLKKLVVQEKPDPNTDTKVELFINKVIWSQFSTKYHGRIRAMMNSILSTLLDDDFMLISGKSVRELRKNKVRTEEDIFALVNENSRLIAENQEVSKENARLSGMFESALMGAKNARQQEE